MECEHLETEEVPGLVGIVSCVCCGAIFDVFHEDNRVSLVTPMTAQELGVAIAASVKSKVYAA